MNLQISQAKFALDASKLIQYIFSQNYSCTFGEAYRTPEQALIYAKKGIGIKNSLHIQRLAIDLNIFSPEHLYLSETKDYERFGIFWESLDKENRWGGKFPKPDGNHFERMLDDLAT